MRGQLGFGEAGSAGLAEHHPGVRRLSSERDLDLEVIGLGPPPGVGKEVEEDPVETGLDVRREPE